MNETNLSRGFEAGSYADSYETNNLDTALDNIGNHDQDYIDAFVMGFLSSYELHEIPTTWIERLEQAYWSRAGRKVVKLGYAELRSWAEYYSST